nr:large proline-rich protein bag6-like isoform X1 [Ciona intestinalis]XP_026694486.1 large proline-rich protein bag6-like isoform X1 [Ciona intestinalis]|eukprot:XP_004227166.2 large proline-rich protein bag6-like isoform X1 [Ciona intestinalis]
MDPNAQPTSNSTNQSTTTNQSSTTTTTTNQTSGSTHQADVHVIQMNMQTPNPSQISGQLPNIPGLPQDVLSNIFQTVAQQVQQQTGGGLPGGHGHGMVVVQGPPGGPNQIQNDISDIIGQGMMNAVNQHMQNVNPPSNFTTNFTTSSVSQTMPSTATSNVTPTPTVTTAAQTETTNEPTPPVQPTEEVPRIANELLSNGNFGSRPLPSHPTTTSRPTPTQPITTVRSTSRPPRPQTRAVPTPTPTPPMPPSGGPSLFSQLFASFGMIGGQSVMGIFRPLVESMSDVTPRDMMGIMTNSSRTLAGLQQNLRRNLCQTYFGGRTRNPTYDEIETCTERSSEELRTSFKSLFDGAQVSPDVDVVESNLSLYRHTMRKIIHLTFNGEESNFQDNLMRHLENMFCIFIRMNESILRGKRPALVDHLLKFMGSGGGFFSLVMGSVEGGNPLDPMINMAVQHCQITQEQIDQFVMNPKPQTTQADNMDDTASGLMVASDDVVDGPRIEMDDVVASDEDGKKNEASGSEDWKLSVPQEWVDTISSDIEKQKSITPQPPFSEAYLAGMPASKRRKVGKTE